MRLETFEYYRALALYDQYSYLNHAHSIISISQSSYRPGGTQDLEEFAIAISDNESKDLMSEFTIDVLWGTQGGGTIVLNFTPRCNIYTIARDAVFIGPAQFAWNHNIPKEQCPSQYWMKKAFPGLRALHIYLNVMKLIKIPNLDYEKEMRLLSCKIELEHFAQIDPYLDKKAPPSLLKVDTAEEFKWIEELSRALVSTCHTFYDKELYGKEPTLYFDPDRLAHGAGLGTAKWRVLDENGVPIKMRVVWQDIWDRRWTMSSQERNHYMLLLQCVIAHRYAIVILHCIRFERKCFERRKFYGENAFVGLERDESHEYPIRAAVFLLATLMSINAAQAAPDHNSHSDFPPMPVDNANEAARNTNVSTPARDNEAARNANVSTPARLDNAVATTSATGKSWSQAAQNIAPTSATGKSWSQAAQNIAPTSATSATGKSWSQAVQNVTTTFMQPGLPRAKKL